MFRFEVLEAMITKRFSLRDKKPCTWLKFNWHFGRTHPTKFGSLAAGLLHGSHFHPEDGDSISLRIVSWLILDYTISYPRRRNSWFWKLSQAYSTHLYLLISVHTVSKGRILWSSCSWPFQAFVTLRWDKGKINVNVLLPWSHFTPFHSQFLLIILS